MSHSASPGRAEPSHASAREPTRQAHFPPEPCTREAIREWDRRAIDHYGIPGMVLMENAGAGAARIILDLATLEPAAYHEPFHILCGPGNNGGDGFVVARHLHNRGKAVDVILVGAVDYPADSDAGRNLEILRRMKSPPVLRPSAPGGLPSSMDRVLAGGTLIDALFGTGLSRPVGSPYLEWVEAMNSSGLVVISLDIPSGLDANTGEILGSAVRATRTLTFAAPKVGFTCGKGPDVCGVVHVVDIGLPREMWT